MPSSTALRGMLDRLRQAMWLVPLLSVTVAATVALVLANFEIRGGELIGITEDPQTARTLLSTAATTTITFAGLVFSITLLALQLTSSQFSPRVLRQFLRAREGQTALGVFAGTFVYVMLVLSRISERNIFVPSLSVTIGLALSLLSLATFVGFVHHITQAIRVVNIIEGVAAEARALADHLERRRDDDPAAETVLAPLAIRSLLTRPGHGKVLQAVSLDGLRRVAEHRSSVIHLIAEPGDYVVVGGMVLEEWAEPASPLDALVWSDVQEHFVFGGERTMAQDLGFGYRQLVDIAEKALSPSLNDPTTAVQAVDRLHDLLRAELDRPPLRSVRVNDAGHGVVGGAVRFESLVDMAFDEIRRYGADALQVVRRLRSAFEDLRDHAPADRRDVFEDKIAQLDRSVDREFTDVDDRVRAGLADEQGMGGAD